jgi:hypothetical protein
VAISADGSEVGILNGGAHEENLPDWSSDQAALSAHVESYFESMGLASCQIANTTIFGGVGGGGAAGGSITVLQSQSSVDVARGISNIPVVESLANARFDSANQTTAETFYWPEIPADVVAAARAFHDQLANPTALAAYKAKLPLDAQGDGQVVIHHSSAGSKPPFQSATTYDVLQTVNPVLGEGSELSFDANGNAVTTVW